MTIFDRFHKRSTGMVRTSNFTPSPVIEYTAEKTGGIQPEFHDINVEYVLSATIGAKFWANDRHREKAGKSAERVLLHSLYGETLSLLAQIRKAVYDGDAEIALLLVEKIEDQLLR